MKHVLPHDGPMIALQTGDELLCSGRGRLSNLIAFYSKLAGIKGPAAEITHVAKYINGLVYEATTLNKWCGKKGYQANPLEDWLSRYDGRVWVRQVHDCGIDEYTYQQHADADLGTPYENGIPGFLELVLTSVALKHGPAWLKNWARKHLQTKELHCSESNVRRSQQGGYYDTKARPNKLAPYTFWAGGEYEKGFTKGRLGPPIRIK